MKIVRSKRKTVALIIEPDGSLLVRAPLRLPRAEIERLVAQKAGWIEEKQHLVAQRAVQNPARAFLNGETFYFLGEKIPLKIVNNMPGKTLELAQGEFRLPAHLQPGAGQIFEAWYRQQARKVITERVQRLAQIHVLQPGRIAITGARTRWGSCGASGSLNFSWRLVQAPLAVIDYVVAHELAHLKERNHSAHFWAEVERLLPGYRPAKAWLKENAFRLQN